MSSTFNNPQGRSHLLGYLGEKVYLVEPIFIVAASHSYSTFETIFVFDSHSNSNFLVVARIAGRASSTYLDFSSASGKCFTNSSNLDTTTGGIRITFRLWANSFLVENVQNLTTFLGGRISFMRSFQDVIRFENRDSLTTKSYASANSQPLDYHVLHSGKYDPMIRLFFFYVFRYG